MMESMFSPEAVGENTRLKGPNSGDAPHVVGDGGDEEVFRGADGFVFVDHVGGVFLEDFEFFGGGADDLAVDPRPIGIQAGAALACLRARAMTFGSVFAAGA